MEILGRVSKMQLLLPNKNVKNTQGGVLILVKLQVSAYNFTKIKTPPWVGQSTIA